MFTHMTNVRTYPYTTLQATQKEGWISFCDAFTTTAVMEVWTCLLSMWSTMSCDIVHKKRTGPMHIKAEHRYSYLTRTNEYYGSETHSSRSCTQYDVHTYPYTSRYRPHKKREGSPFCNNAYTTTAVMEVLTCLLSMCYLLLCHRTQKANWTRAHKS